MYVYCLNLPSLGHYSSIANIRTSLAIALTRSNRENIALRFICIKTIRFLPKHANHAAKSKTILQEMPAKKYPTFSPSFQ